jgi:flagellin-like protein
VPADRIAANLAFINWTVLSGLGVGSFAAVVIGQFRTSATKGYLAFTAFTSAIFGGLAWLADGALPAGARPGEDFGILPLLGDPWDTPRSVALAAFAVLALVTAVATAWGAHAWTLAAAGLATGLFALFAGAAAWGDSPVGTALLLVQFVVLAAATGGVWSAMILGHWYLVTPKLPEAPLVLFARILLAVVAAQVVLFVAWLAIGAGPGGSAGFAALTGPWALFVWLRLGVGLIFPLVVSWAAIQTARSRSMESATGLLYINVGTIAAGTILAAGLYFGAGILA